MTPLRLACAAIFGALLTSMPLAAADPYVGYYDDGDCVVGYDGGVCGLDSPGGGSGSGDGLRAGAGAAGTAVCLDTSSPGLVGSGGDCAHMILDLTGSLMLKSA